MISGAILISDDLVHKSLLSIFALSIKIGLDPICVFVIVPKVRGFSLGPDRAICRRLRMVLPVKANLADTAITLGSKNILML